MGSLRIFPRLRSCDVLLVCIFYKSVLDTKGQRLSYTFIYTFQPRGHWSLLFCHWKRMKDKLSNQQPCLCWVSLALNLAQTLLFFSPNPSAYQSLAQNVFNHKLIHIWYQYCMRLLHTANIFHINPYSFSVLHITASAFKTLSNLIDHVAL